MGAVLWLLAAVALLWFSLVHVLPLDIPLLLIIGIMLAGVCVIKAIADAIDAISAMGDIVAERRGDFDD